MATLGAGKDEKSSNFEDGTRSIANKEYFLEIVHIPTGKVVQFKAMLTAYQDKYDSKWSDEDVYGRMDPMSIFKGTKRQISLGWAVVAASEGEAKDNLRKISLLVSMLYPVYEADKTSNASSMTAAPLLKLSFANLVTNSGTARSTNADTSGLVGKVSGLAVAPEMEEGFFDREVGVLYPKSFKLSFEYTVFHTHRVGWIKGQDFAVKNFPYGVAHFEGRDIKGAKISIQDNKTTSQKKAAVNKITNPKKKTNK